MREADREELHRELKLEQKERLEERASREKVKLQKFLLFTEMFRNNKR